MGFGKIAMLLRFPIGVVAAITPFNAPVNLACHKIGPAIAAGNVVVLKAPPQGPGVIHGDGNHEGPLGHLRRAAQRPALRCPG